MSTGEEKITTYPMRRAFLLGVIGVAVFGLLWRAVDLHVLDRDFLQHQGDARSMRVVTVAAHRGMITDRHGEPLAISTPVDSVWANPQELAGARARWPQLARVLKMDLARLQDLVGQRQDREFIYLRRQLNPDWARQVMALGIPGVSLQREYRRYYPTAEVTAHVVGFTNVDDAGQEGAELMYDDWLRGTPGSKRVIKDRLGRTVENVERIAQARPGHDLRLSIDRRIQYLAYRELKSAVQRNRAKSGSAVVLDARTGEVLAMVNQPSYNPNNRRDLRSNRYRNRAVTDLFEPGSTMKPFTIAAALSSGKYHPDTAIDTSPGWYRLAGNTIRDARDYGLIDVARGIKKSSNVGASRIALSLDSKLLWRTYKGVGFGITTGSGFPGEASGLLPNYTQWSRIEQATLAYGYGLSVTPLQLAQAFAVLADDGRLHPVTFQARDPDAGPDKGMQILDPAVVRQVRHMLEGVVQRGGTGTRAAIPGYRVAGKTGTVRKASDGGYSEEHYMAIFAGMAPASRPRLVMVVVVNDPGAGKYYGGLVAAPVFAHVMAGALRLLDVPPDDLPSLGTRVALLEDTQ